MRTLLLLGFLPAIAAAQGPASPDRRGGPARPSLAVVVSVDQLATWVLRDAEPHLRSPGGGFARLFDDGVYFERCAFRHGCTETGPGHATIGTGAPAAVHGIVANQWRDPATGRRQYCARTPDAKGLAGGGDGLGAAMLLVPTLGDALKQQLGAECKVASFSFKDRAAILMAGASADLCAWIDLRAGRFGGSTAFCRTLPAWLDRFNGRRPLDRFFGHVWQRIGPADAYAGLVDSRPYERPDAHGRRTLPQVVDGGLDAPGPAFYQHLYASPYANDAIVELASRAVDGMKLGRDDHPDLLCLGFSALDVVGHRNGPRSVEARDLLLRLDRQLGELFRMLDSKVGAGRYLLFLSADHGVAPAPETRAGLPGGRDPRLFASIRAAAENALTDLYGQPPDGARAWVLGLGSGSIYLARAALEQRRIDRDQAAAAVARAVEGLAAVARGFPTGRLRSADSDAGDELLATVRATVHEGRSGDVFYVLEPYWMAYATTAATHGSPHAYDREVPLFAYGPGLRHGHRSATPVTPGTIPVLAAALLGVEPPSGARNPLPADALR